MARQVKSSVFLIICIVCGGIFGIFIVGGRVRLTTIIILLIVSSIRAISILVILSLELTDVSDGDLAFRNGGELVWAFLSFVVWLVVSQCLSAVHLGLPHHLVLTPSQDAAHFVHMCHSRNAPG